ncbi:unnamed protein product [Fusarium graminearum]|uniref:Chromosome 2, complete genome n=1 Tax=Gibberella zeae (strain ATCC MYA-4620 / CBS 123657 / FGSC 9075 / NRRL 31084 / PH-1) TaxID=229533 RepID=A0A098DEQ8_GIBZE|nr:unnamed protein product [Fusarium graminearum]
MSYSPFQPQLCHRFLKKAEAEQRHMGPHGIVSIGCPSRRTSNYQSHGT